MQICTHIMIEAFTSKVAIEPGKCFLHSSPDLQVTWVPVVGEVMLLAEVAKDSNTSKYKEDWQTNTMSHRAHNHGTLDAIQ